MAKLTDFFPKASTSISEKREWGQAGKPDYIVDILAIGGGAGASYSDQHSLFGIIGGAGPLAGPASSPSDFCQQDTGSWTSYGSGGGIFCGNNVAIYSGCTVTVTVGSGGASAPTPNGLFGTPSAKGTPGGDTSFGCITAYGGGSNASGCISGFQNTTCVYSNDFGTPGSTENVGDYIIPGDNGGVGGAGFGVFGQVPSGIVSNTFSLKEEDAACLYGVCLAYCTSPTSPFAWTVDRRHKFAGGGLPIIYEVEGLSYNFKNQFGIHRGRRDFSVNNIVTRCYLGVAGASPSPNYKTPIAAPTCQYPLSSGCEWIPTFYCLDVDCTNYRCELGGNNDLPTAVSPTATHRIWGVWGDSTYLGYTQCTGPNMTSNPVGSPTGGVLCGVVPSSHYVEGCDGTGAGGGCGFNGRPGAVWIVYPTNYPAATTTGAIDCSTAVKTGYRAYKFTSTGTFQMS